MARRRGSVLAAWLLCSTALGGLLTACSSGDDASLLGDSRSDPSVVRQQEQKLLDLRARAVEDHDLKAFMAPVDRSDRALVARQRRYYANLSQLPIQDFGYRVLARSWPETLMDPSWGKHVTLPQVRVDLQLEGFDSKPEQQVTGIAFAERDGSLKIVADRTPSGAVFPGSRPAPWDLTRIHVRDSYDVLAVFDDASWQEAEGVSTAVQDGIWSISEVLPFAWEGRVVVYAFSNQQVLSSFEDVPGGNINHLGAMTFPVYADAGRKAPVGMRFTLLPSSLKAGQPFLGRIIRHELSHVAIGQRDDGDPTWVSEGIAEYLGARELPAGQRRIPTVAVTNARAGVRAMPASLGFNGDDQEWHYALSWMACDYIATSQGEARLWQLMDRLHAAGRGTSDANQDIVLQQVLGFGGRVLAQRAAARILQLYG